MLLRFVLFILLSVLVVAEEEHYILRWRKKNNPMGILRVYDSATVGMGTRDKVTKVKIGSVPLFVKCIKDKREENEELEKTGYLNYKSALIYFGECVCEEMYKDKGVKCEGTVDYSKKDLAVRYFDKFHLATDYGSVKFYDEVEYPDKSENVFVKTITNRGTEKAESSISVAFQTKSSNSSSESNEIGGSFGVDVEINAGFYTFKSSTEIGGSVKNEETKTEEKTESFTIKKTFTVLPKSAVQLNCSVKMQQFEMKYKIPIIVKGAVAVKYSDNKYVIIPASTAAPFFPDFHKTEDNPARLATFVRGTVSGVRHYDAEVFARNVTLQTTIVKKEICRPLPQSF